MPAAKVEIWPIERLTANPRNARIHGPEQIEQIRASLREFGWTMPVLVRENGMLIAGHGRIEERRCRAADARWLAELHPDWAGLRSIAAVTPVCENRTPTGQVIS